MRFQTLKSKLLFSVSAPVILSVLFVSLLVIERYSRSLRDTLAAQSENLAHALALTAADLILINNLVGLQKQLDMQQKSNDGISYIFVWRDEDVLAHTFEKGVPVGLAGANVLEQGEEIRFQEIASKEGERYMDIALPIFSGKAGALRMGFSKLPYRKQMTKIWMQIGSLTLLILAIAFVGTLLFIRRVIRPLAGQSHPVGPKAEQYPQFITYFPSIWEWLVFVFSLAIMLVLYTLGERFLKLAQKPE